MARSRPQTQGKRLREQAKRDKRRAKEERRAARHAAKGTDKPDDAIAADDPVGSLQPRPGEADPAG